jgi:prepilin-type N-terminal cleavage/methylation domain-containing protein
MTKNKNLNQNQNHNNYNQTHNNHTQEHNQNNEQNNPKKPKKKGFTLVELIAVMAILGILALLIIPRFTTMTEGARVRVFENTVRTYQSGISMWIADNNGTLPTLDTHLRAIEGAYLPADWHQGDPTNGNGRQIAEPTIAVTAGEPIVTFTFNATDLANGPYVIRYNVTTGVSTKVGW